MRDIANSLLHWLDIFHFTQLLSFHESSYDLDKTLILKIRLRIKLGVDTLT